MDFEKICERLNALLENGRKGEMRGALLMLNEVDIAQYLETLDNEKLLMVFRLLPKDISAEVFSYMENEERYKEAVQWCDYLYSDEGMVLKCFGVEGNTFTIEKNDNGEEHYVYTDLIYDHEKLGAHSVEAALYHFMRPAAGPGFGEHSDYHNGFYPYEQQKEALGIWNENSAIAYEHALPPLTYTGEEATRDANIQALGRDELNAAILNIVMGKQTIDTYDKAIAKAKKAGYDELIKIAQNAYNRSLKKLK